MYPGQKQTFNVTNEPAPIIWSTTGLTLNDDRTLDGYLNNAGVVLAVARSGICRIKWTFETGMLPDTGQTVDMRMTANSTSGTKVLIAKAGLASTVITDGTSTLTTITRTLVAGDYYIIEKAGNIFRLYINSETAASYTYDPGVAIRYPGYCQISWGNLSAGVNSYITLPELLGDWGVVPGVSGNAGDWTCTNGSTAGGTFVDASEILRVEFTAGSTPGAYTMSCVIAGQASQTATSVVTIAPLTIAGETEVILQPGESRKFVTNYDQNNLRTTWSVITGGGGSFTNDIYTAPTAPGTYTIRSTYGNQAADIAVTVPVTITSSVGISTALSDRLRIQAATLGETVTFTTNMTGSITWEADYGTLSGSGSSFAWTAPNSSQINARITATNGTLTKTVECPVLKKIPYDPSARIEGELKKTVVLFRAEDRSRYSRIKDKDQENYRTYTLSFQNRTAAEFDDMGAFWDEHYSQKRVIFEDKARGTTIRRVVYFDSDISYSIGANCPYDYSFRIAEG